MIIHYLSGEERPPRERGAYLIGLTLSVKRDISIGRLGRFVFYPGVYCYIGSAFGPGGLLARVGRHQRTNSSKHWHFDYLKTCTQIDHIWYTFNSIEHQWANLLIGDPNLTVPVPGFGASDCSCRSHLFYLSSGELLSTIKRVSGKLCG